MAEHFRPITINFASVNVAGVPGLMLVLIAMAIAVEFPEASWLVAGGIGGGAIVAAALVVLRTRRRRTAPLDAGDPLRGLTRP